jgi:hypothetical protein
MRATMLMPLSPLSSSRLSSDSTPRFAYCGFRFGEASKVVGVAVG